MCVFDLQDMIALTKGPGSQAQRLAAAMWEQVESVSQRLVDVGRRSALGRTAQFILQLELRLRSRQMSVDGSFDFPVRQEHMADALGLTTVYVNRTLDRLRRLEIIQFNRNRMTVRNFEALRDIAELE
jgi:CRP/FNR family transcriptional regulator, anaerobic regulatory protein